MYVMQPLTYFVKFRFFFSLKENLIFTWIQASIRRSASYLIGHLFENSKLFLDDEAPGMISTLIVLLSDSDHDTVVVVLANTSLMFSSIFTIWSAYYFFHQQTAWEALSKVVTSIPKEVLPSHIKLVRDAVSTARDKERRKKKVRFYGSLHRLTYYLCQLGILNTLSRLNEWLNLQGGSILVPGFCLPKALQPVLPIFLQVTWWLSPAQYPIDWPFVTNQRGNFFLLGNLIFVT